MPLRTLEVMVKASVTHQLVSDVVCFRSDSIWAKSGLAAFAIQRQDTRQLLCEHLVPMCVFHGSGCGLLFESFCATSGRRNVSHALCWPRPSLPSLDL